MSEPENEMSTEVKDVDGVSSEECERKSESSEEDNEENSQVELETTEKEKLKVSEENTLTEEEHDKNNREVEEGENENFDKEGDGENEEIKVSEEQIPVNEGDSGQGQMNNETEVKIQQNENVKKETDSEENVNITAEETETLEKHIDKKSVQDEDRLPTVTSETLNANASEQEKVKSTEVSKSENFPGEKIIKAVPVEVKITGPADDAEVFEGECSSSTEKEKANGDADGTGEMEVIIADLVKPKKKRKIPHLHLGKRSQKKYYPSKHMIKLEIIKPGRTSTKRTEKCHDIAVYLIEKTGRLLTIEEGVGFSAGLLLNKMIENLGLPLEARQVFSIWLSSPFLELQLKPHHKPCELRRQWAQLLQRFTTATEEQIKRDEPILSFQRNVFFSLTEEKKIMDDGIIKRLFEEAKYNFLTCQYPVSQEDAEMLGSILVYIEKGAYDEEKHSTTEFLHHKLRSFLPSYTWKSPWPFVTYWTKRQEHQRLLDAYKEISSKLSSLKSCHLAFLQFCWTLPFYGSVFFHGQVEQQATGYWHTLFGHPDILVRVAINTKGIHIIEDSSNEILLGLNLNDFSWDYVACDEQDVDCMDTLWVEYDESDPEHEGHTISTQLPVFSKQAIMMDAMIETCTSCYLAGLQQTGDGAFKRSHSKRMERVSVTAYTDEGEPFVRNKPTNFSLSNPLRRLRAISTSEQETRQ